MAEGKRKEGTTGILLLSHPSWAWLELAPIMLVEPSTACTSEAATMTPSARDVLSGKEGSRWAKHSTPSLCGRHGLREGDCFYQSRDSAGRGRFPVGFSSKEGMAKHSKEQSAMVPGERFQDVVCHTDTQSQTIQPREQPYIPPDIEMRRRRDNSSRLMVSRVLLNIISLRIC